MVFNSRCLCFYVVTLEIVSGNIKTSLWFQNFSEAQAWYSASFCQLTQGFFAGWATPEKINSFFHLEMPGIKEALGC